LVNSNFTSSLRRGDGVTSAPNIFPSTRYRTVTLDLFGPRLVLRVRQLLTTTDVSHAGSMGQVANAAIFSLCGFRLESLAPSKSSLQYFRTTEVGEVSSEAIFDCAPIRPVKQNKNVTTQKNGRRHLLTQFCEASFSTADNRKIGVCPDFLEICRQYTRGSAFSSHQPTAGRRVRFGAGYDSAPGVETRQRDKLSGYAICWTLSRQAVPVAF
jgi:hypothetical protein